MSSILIPKCRETQNPKVCFHLTAYKKWNYITITNNRVQEEKKQPQHEIGLPKNKCRLFPSCHSGRGKLIRYSAELQGITGPEVKCLD